MSDIQHLDWTLIGVGDLVTIHMPIEGTFENDLMGMPPNGTEVSLWMANI